MARQFWATREKKKFREKRGKKALLSLLKPIIPGTPQDPPTLIWWRKWFLSIVPECVSRLRGCLPLVPVPGSRHPQHASLCWFIKSLAISGVTAIPVHWTLPSTKKKGGDCPGLIRCAALKTCASYVFFYWFFSRFLVFTELRVTTMPHDLPKRSRPLITHNVNRPTHRGAKITHYTSYVLFNLIIMCFLYMCAVVQYTTMPCLTKGSRPLKRHKSNLSTHWGAIKTQHITPGGPLRGDKSRATLPALHLKEERTPENPDSSKNHRLNFFDRLAANTICRGLPPIKGSFVSVNVWSLVNLNV